MLVWAPLVSIMEITVFTMGRYPSTAVGCVEDIHCLTTHPFPPVDDPLFETS